MKLTSKHLAELAAVSDGYIRRLTREGILPTPDKDGYDALPAIKALIQHYKARNEKASDIAAEKFRLTKEQADKVALENAKSRSELVKVRDVAPVISKSLESIKATITAASNLEAEDKEKIIVACRQCYESAFIAAGADAGRA
jgi:phage terminase Nu1 subunit (DNA packaging protein)